MNEVKANRSLYYHEQGISNKFLIYSYIHFVDLIQAGYSRVNTIDNTDEKIVKDEWTQYEWIHEHRGKNLLVEGHFCS